MKKQSTVIMMALSILALTVQKSFSQVTSCFTDAFGEPATLILTPTSGSTFAVTGTVYYDIFGLPNYYVLGTYDGKNMDFTAYNPDPNGCTLSADSVVFKYHSAGDKRYFNGKFINNCGVSGLLSASWANGACPNTGPKGTNAFSTAFSKSTNRLEVSSSNLNVYPNPAASQVTVNYTVSGNQQVTIAVYNVTGQLVKTLASDIQASGSYTINWNLKDEKGFNVPQGSYFITMRSGDNSKTEKLIVTQ